MDDGFVLLSPQVAYHSTGFTVSVVDRHSLQYVDEAGRASVEMEIGTTFAVYPASLRRDPGVGRDLTNREVVDRIAHGLEAMGSRVENVEG